MDNKDNIKIVKRSQKLSDDELSNIAGGRKFIYEGVEYEVPDIPCPYCESTNVDDSWHDYYFNPLTHVADSIYCKRKGVHGSFIKNIE